MTLEKRLEQVERLLAGLVRYGTVTDVDTVKHRARVKYEGEDITSGWLYVLNSRPFIPDYTGPQQTEEQAGGSGYAAFSSHAHTLIIKQWMPKVTDRVVVLYLPVFNADGFVLGGVD